MTVTFTLFSGTTSSSSPQRGCCFSAPNKYQNLTRETVDVDQKEFEASQQQNENQENQQWVHKYHALFTAAVCPQIHSICFLPTHPNQSQLLYAQRGKAPFDPKGFITSYTEFSEVRDAQVFQLSDAISLSESTYDLNPSVKPFVRRILGHLMVDNETLGVGLRFFNNDNNLITYLWIKI